MKISICSKRPVLSPCGLKNFDYQVDTYIGCGHYCYYCYAINQTETDWSKEILIHENIIEQLEKELEGIPAQSIYMGYHSDPYQPCEITSHQTRNVLELLLKRGFSANILTKSDLVIRDIDILKEMKSAAVSVSVAFNNKHDRSHFEANTIDTQCRMDALSTLKKAGIKTGAVICPVIPYITNPKFLIDDLAPFIDEIWIYGLSINDRSARNWQYLHEIFLSQYPELIESIESVLFSKDHIYWTQLREELTTSKNDREINLNIHL